jgi:hypothetical protein
MLLIIKKAIFLVGLTLYITSAHSQTVTSTRNGVWNDPSIWSGGFVPTSVNATGIVIDHEVELPSMFVVSAYYLIVNGKLTLKGSCQLTILTDTQPLIPDLTTSGTLVKEEGAVLNGTSTTNTAFTAGSVYIHQQGPLGFIPYATWDKSSTFIINGFRDSGYINIAHSDSWKQSFGNVIYDCPLQTIFVVDLNGYLRNITGDFIIKSTNNKTLRLSTTQNPTITIGGSLIVEGPSEVWFSTNGTSPVVSIQKDFKYTSTSAGPSYLTTRGMISVNILGNFEWNSAGPMRMASSSADSLGMRRAVVNISGNFSVSNGVIIAPPSGSGNGRIVFNGNGVQVVTTSSTGSSFLGNLDYIVDPGSIVDLGNSALSNTIGSLQVFGTLRVGSTDSQGAIQLTNKGNIHISGNRRYEPGSTIEYNGSSPQWIGNGQPSATDVNLVITNPTITSLLQDVSCRDFILSGGILSGITSRVTVHGNAVAESLSMVDIETLRLEGNSEQSIDIQNLTINNISINKSVGSVSLDAPVRLRGVLQIESSNTILRSDGNLTLLSASDSGSGTASVGSLPTGSRIDGDVTVQRYMSAEGRTFRYISSPVVGASVESLMDDFAVTGKFADPTTANVGNPKTPSFYYYDESQGSLQGGWKPYPTAGLAQDNPLLPGLGYCALIRESTTPVVWDVTGRLNQGDIALPVALTADSAPSNGWNLVGNPYPCPIDWDIDGPNGWTKQNISPVFCIRDNGIGSWGNVRYWDGDINYSDIPEGQIAVGQSFWVKAIGPNPQLTVREGVKVTADASFYREAQLYIPSFVLILKKDSYMDKAYYKVRQGAKATFDQWDGIKMDNDNFDISTFSDDGFSLAINSRDSLPCGEKNVKVRVKDLKKGTYKLELDTRYDFSAYHYTWIDNYFGTETSLQPGEEIDIEVTGDSASKSPGRFTLRLNEIMPAGSQTVSAPTSVCTKKVIPITILDVQYGIHYSVWENGRRLTAEHMGSGNDLIIEVNSDSIASGTHRFDVVARSACQQITLISHAIVQYEAVELSIPQVFVCENETATLSVTSNVNVRTYSWFASDTSTDTLATGQSWTTPPLLKSQTYHVSASLGSGCNSDRQPVKVDVIIAPPATITLKDSDILCSNYLSNNLWMFNGVLISNENELFVDQTGTYALIVDTLGCVSSDSIEFINESVGSIDLADVDIYPNPVIDYLNLPSLDHAAQLDIIGSSGNICLTLSRLDMPVAEGLVIDIKSLASGTYFAVIRIGQRKRVLKFVKVD